MAIVMSQDGLRWALALVRQQLPYCTIRLFVNDFTPIPTMTVDDFVEPTWDAYSGQRFDLWGNVFINAQGYAETSYSTVYFVIGAAGGQGTVYGYFITNQYGYVVFAERDPAEGVFLNGAGAIYPVVPRLFAGPIC